MQPSTTGVALNWAAMAMPTVCSDFKMNKLSPTLNQFDVLDKLIESDFNLHLTAEKLDVKPSKVLSQLSPDTETTIINHMKVRMVLEAYTLWKGSLPFFLAAISEAEPKDVMRAFGQLTETMSSITKVTNQAPQGAQIGQVVLNMLPPEVRDRVLELLPQNIISVENASTAIAEAPHPVQSENANTLERSA